ncbi:hypothetical protein [Streptomyces sp. NPDC001089]
MTTLELAPGKTAYVGRDGQALTLIEWAIRREDREYRIVARTEYLDCVVQAEWEGVADTVEVGFMYVIGIRWANEWTTVWHAHWPCTEAEAKAKHAEIVALLRETCPEPPTWQTRHEFNRRIGATPATAG